MHEATMGEMALADYAGGNRQAGNGDERLRVQFSTFPQINEDKSAQEGRPIFDEKEYITIMVPGERDVVHRAVWAKDLQRFPLQYQAFKNKQNQDTASGTPLKMVTWLTPGQVKELEFFNCHTVEQLANMADSAASKFMAIQRLKTLAKDYLKAAKEAAPLTAMRDELDKRDSQIAALQNQMAELMALKAAQAPEQIQKGK